LLLLLLLPKKKILLAVWLWLLVNPNGIVCAAQLLCVASGQKQIDGPCRTDRARRLYISPPCYRIKGPAPLVYRYILRVLGADGQPFDER
jgi:hypothetical protein